MILSHIQMWFIHLSCDFSELLYSSTVCVPWLTLVHWGFQAALSATICGRRFSTETWRDRRDTPQRHLGVLNLVQNPTGNLAEVLEAGQTELTTVTDYKEINTERPYVAVFHHRRGGVGGLWLYGEHYYIQFAVFLEYLEHGLSVCLWQWSG